MREVSTAEARAGRPAYYALWIPIMFVVFCAIAVQHIRGISLSVPIFFPLIVGVAASFCLIRLRLRVDGRNLSYRGIFRTFSYPLELIESVSFISMGRQQIDGVGHGPGIFFIIHIKEEGKAHVKALTAKAFNIEEIAQVLAAIKKAGISIELNVVTLELLNTKHLG